jgi:hypothetical protein
MSAALKLDHLNLDQVFPEEPSLSWLCAFCGKTRVYEGGRPLVFGHLDTCATCESRVAVEPADCAAVAAMIDRHLL